MYHRLKSTVKDVVVCAKKRAQGQLSLDDPLFQSFVKNYNYSRSYWAGEELSPMSPEWVMEQIDAFIRELEPFSKDSLQKEGRNLTHTAWIGIRQAPRPILIEEPLRKVSLRKEINSREHSLFRRPLEDVELILALHEECQKIDRWHHEGLVRRGEKFEYISIDSCPLTRSLRNRKRAVRNLDKEKMVELIGEDRVKVHKAALNRAVEQILTELWSSPEHLEQFNEMKAKLDRKTLMEDDIRDETYNTSEYLTYVSLQDLKTLHKLIGRWQEAIEKQRFSFHPWSLISKEEKRIFRQIVARIYADRKQFHSHDRSEVPFEFTYRLLLAKDIAERVDQIGKKYQDVYQLFTDLWKKEGENDYRWTPQPLPEHIGSIFRFTRSEQELMIAMAEKSAEQGRQSVPLLELWKSQADVRGMLEAADQLQKEGLLVPQAPTLSSPQEIESYALQIHPERKAILRKIVNHILGDSVKKKKINNTIMPIKSMHNNDKG